MPRRAGNRISLKVNGWQTADINKYYMILSV